MVGGDPYTTAWAWITGVIGLVGGTILLAGGNGVGVVLLLGGVIGVVLGLFGDRIRAWSLRQQDRDDEV